MNCFRCQGPLQAGASFCHHCGTAQPPAAAEPVAARSWFCPKCGFSNLAVSSNCSQCGQLSPWQAPPQQQVQQRPPMPPSYQPVNLIVDIPKSRGVYIVLGLFLGGLGIHNFYAGRNGAGIAQLMISIIAIPLWIIVIGFFMTLGVWFWVFIEVISVDTDGYGRRMR